MIKIKFSQNFIKSFKKIQKKNKNLINDLKDLEEELKENPKKGTSLGSGLYKIRMANSSKKIGKKSAFRIISYFIDENDVVYLVEIYEKNTIENISITKIKQVIKNEIQ